MDATRVVITVDCKVPLSEADLRFLELDVASRLQTTLVQKFASVIFEREHHGQETPSPQR